MSVLFTREGISAYLAKKIIPCRPEFQIRKLGDKKYEHNYNIHLLGGYRFIIIDFMRCPRTLPQGTFDRKLIYVDPDTLNYKVYEKNGEIKEGKLPGLDKFQDLHSKREDFWTLFAILEILTAVGHTSKILDDPLLVCDYPCYDGNDYSTIFRLPRYNPGDTTMLTSEDESRIAEYCRNRYKISICENLSGKSNKDIDEWTIYLDQDKPECKIRGRDGNVHEHALDDWTYLEAKEIEPKVSTGLLMSISEKYEIYFDYFNARYINYVATNNADEFKKLVYIMNRYSEELGFSLVRVLAESDGVTYYRQAIKYKQLFDGELDAFIVEGAVTRLTEDLYCLPKRFEFDYTRRDENIHTIPFEFFSEFMEYFALYWAEMNKLTEDDLRVYKYTKSISHTINESLYRGELKLHHPLTGEVVEYHDDESAQDCLLDWYELTYFLNKNGIGTPKIEEFQDFIRRLNPVNNREASKSNDSTVDLEKDIKAADGKTETNLMPDNKKAKWHAAFCWLLPKVLMDKYKDKVLPTKIELAKQVLTKLGASPEFIFSAEKNNEQQRNIISISERGELIAINYCGEVFSRDLPLQILDKYGRGSAKNFDADIIKNDGFQQEICIFLNEKFNLLILNPTDELDKLAVNAERHLFDWGGILSEIPNTPEFSKIRIQLHNKTIDYGNRQQAREKTMARQKKAKTPAETSSK